jgi:hypothetical protein
MAATVEGGAVAGPEWLCRFCGTRNGGSARCRSCGAEREAAMAGPAEGSAAAAPRRQGRAGLIAAVALLLVAVGGVAGYLRLQKGREAVTITGFEWERSVEVQDHRTVREEAWEGEVPAGARIIARRRQVHHTDRQQAGPGKVKERPVYRQRIAYDLEQWSVARTLKASGKGKSPRWPDIRLNLGEREGKRSESYVVVLQGRGVYRMEVPRERWLEMREGQMGNAIVQKGAVLELK